MIQQVVSATEANSVAVDVLKIALAAQRINLFAGVCYTWQDVPQYGRSMISVVMVLLVDVRVCALLPGAALLTTPYTPLLLACTAVLTGEERGLQTIIYRNVSGQIDYALEKSAAMQSGIVRSLGILQHYQGDQLLGLDSPSVQHEDIAALVQQITVDAPLARQQCAARTVELSACRQTFLNIQDTAQRVALRATERGLASDKLSTIHLLLLAEQVLTLGSSISDARSRVGFALAEFPHLTLETREQLSEAVGSVSALWDLTMTNVEDILDGQHDLMLTGGLAAARMVARTPGNSTRPIALDDVVEAWFGPLSDSVMASLDVQQSIMEAADGRSEASERDMLERVAWIVVTGGLLLVMSLGLLLRWVTLERQRLERLKTIEFMRTGMLRYICHEVRNPLTGIVGGLQLFERHKLDADTRDILDSMDKCAAAINGVVDRSLRMDDFMSADSSGLMLQPLQVSIMLRDLLQQFKYTKGVSMAASVAAGVPNILMLDDARMRAVIVNGLTNSLKQSKPLRGKGKKLETAAAASAGAGAAAGAGSASAATVHVSNPDALTSSMHQEIQASITIAVWQLTPAEVRARKLGRPAPPHGRVAANVFAQELRIANSNTVSPCGTPQQISSQTGLQGSSTLAAGAAAADAGPATAALPPPPPSIVVPLVSRGVEMMTLVPSCADSRPRASTTATTALHGVTLHQDATLHETESSAPAPATTTASYTAIPVTESGGNMDASSSVSRSQAHHFPTAGESAEPTPCSLAPPMQQSGSTHSDVEQHTMPWAINKPTLPNEATAPSQSSGGFRASAAQAMGQPSTVGSEAGYSGSLSELALASPVWLCVQVADHGDGLPDGCNLDRLLQLRVTSGDRGTSGLGLYVSSCMATSMGGQLQLRNRDDGVRGAVLELLVPVFPTAHSAMLATSLTLKGSVTTASDSALGGPASGTLLESPFPFPSTHGPMLSRSSRGSSRGSRSRYQSYHSRYTASRQALSPICSSQGSEGRASEDTARSPAGVPSYCTDASPAGLAPSPPIGTVLLCDDDAINRRMAERMLKREKWDVITATDGDELLGTWTAHKDVVTAIVTDIIMIRKDGIEAAGELRAAGYTGPLIAMTGNVLPDDLHRYLAAGFDGALAKPLRVADFADFTAYVQRLLSGADATGSDTPASQGSQFVAFPPSPAPHSRIE